MVSPISRGRTHNFSPSSTKNGRPRYLARAYCPSVAGPVSRARVTPIIPICGGVWGLLISPGQPKFRAESGASSRRIHRSQ
jgi:hypothetical protein